MIEVAVLFERYGKVRKAFRKLGVDAYSFDVEGDALLMDLYNGELPEARMAVAFPPCTNLCNANSRNWRSEKIGREVEMWKRILRKYDKVCIENPIGVSSMYFGKATQIIHPWMFGDPYMKQTGS